jgi:uncharacterized membrane protein
VGKQLTLRNHSPDGVEILIRPNRSLSPSAMLALVVAVVLVSLTIGSGFWLMGAFLILPFAGLEALVVAVVFWLLHRHQADCERIAIAGDRVDLIRSVGGREFHERFQRYWARVRTDPTRDAQLPRVLLGSHGYFVEIGSALDGPGREALAQELKARLRGPER